MFAAVNGMAIWGLKACPIRVEVDVANGLPGFDLVGLPATAVREARDRVRSAIRNSGFQFPLQRVTVNLAPADLRKDGSGFDLPIAIGILAATGQCPPACLEKYVFTGELSLEGVLRPVPGVLTMAVAMYDADEPAPTLVVPPDNLREARLAQGVASVSQFTLQELVDSLQGRNDFINSQVIETEVPEEQVPAVDLRDIRGQVQAKRALEIAAAGGHNLLMAGAPGSGKTMLARAFAGILPPLTGQESMEVTQLYSLAGMLAAKGSLIRTRPFRNPHHTASIAGIIGGGRDARPGELALANHGVLFLDELPEFPREILEALRQPLEDRKLVVTRQKGSVEYPTRLSVIAGMNPCPCGFLGDRERACHCTPTQVHNYWKRISGPLLDRFDLQVEVPRLNYDELRDGVAGDDSATVRARVQQARQRQWVRLGDGKTNAEMTAKETKEFCRLTPVAESLLQRVFKERRLSARAHDRILRVALTIADLAGEDTVKPEFMAEAVQLRALDNNGLSADYI